MTDRELLELADMFKVSLQKNLMRVLKPYLVIVKYLEVRSERTM